MDWTRNSSAVRWETGGCRSAGPPRGSWRAAVLGVMLAAALPLSSARGDLTTQTEPLQQNRIGRLETAVLFPDGEQVVTAGATGVYLWDRGDLLLELPPGDSPVHAVQLSPDEQVLLAANRDQAVLRELTNGTVLQTFAAPADFQVTHVALSRDGREVITACRSRDSVRFLAWNAGDGSVIREFSLPDKESYTVAISADGTRVLTGTTAGVATLRDGATGQAIATFSIPGDSGAVTAGAFSADGSRIVTGSRGGKVCLWSADPAASGNPIRVFRSDGGEVEAVAFSPDATRVLSGGMSHEARLWNVSNGCEIHTFAGHKGGVDSLAFSRDGGTVLTASGGSTGDQAVKLWDAESGRRLSSIVRHTGSPGQALFTPDGSGVVTVGGAGGTKLWDASTGEPTQALSSEINAAVPLADGKSILMVHGGNAGEVWNASLRKRLWSIKGMDWSSRSAVSPDQKMLLTAKDGWRMAPDSLYFRDLQTGALISAIADEDLHWVRAVAFTPDGKTAVTASRVPTGYSGSVMLWDPLSRRRLQNWPLKSGAETAALSPDGSRMAVCCYDGSLLLLELATGRILQTFTEDGPVNPEVAFSPDGKKLLSIGSDGMTAALWDAGTGEKLQVFGGHTDDLTSVDFSPDGTRALTASRDGTWRIWLLTSR